VASIIRIVNAIHFLFLAAIILLAFVSYQYVLDDEFRDGFLPLLIMLPGFYFFSITLLLAAFFSAKRFLWVNFTGSLICLLIIVTSDLFLIPAWGIHGAAIANLAAYSAASFFNIFMFNVKTGTRFFELLMIQKSDIKNIKEVISKK
jgi:O-antigen/teichoic acid export membrane protein